MLRRLLVVFLLAVMVIAIASCSNKNVKNPIADLGSKQPDKVLFDRAMDAMKHNKFDVARMTLQTLINTYPDSEFLARAKLAIGDSWYAEGGSASYAQAEAEYKDFETFFPNMAEAAEAQMKIANIHYKQMEKPDRDYTHAKRAEQEYRIMIQQYPDSTLVPEAKERLREVQEVLAEREFRVGRFYYMRQSWNAAIARLSSLADSYPLYSGADEALFMLGQAYEREADTVRAVRMNETVKGRVIKDFQDKAAAAYSRILTRYPIMDRTADAKARLEAMKYPVPQATPEAVAQNKAEEASRQEVGLWGRMMLNMHKRPDVAETARVGDPTLVDPKPISAPDLAKHTRDVIEGKAEGSGSQKVTVEQVGSGEPAPNQPVPRSDQSAAAAANDPNAIPELTPLNNGDPAAAPAQPAPAQPSAEASPAPPVPPQQVNEAAQPKQQQGQASSDTAATDKNAKSDSKDVSSSKSKKKKGIKRIIPF
jgi:outer membrane protein assembly factor BamD